MTEESLQAFMDRRKPEYSWVEKNNEEVLLLFIDIERVAEFKKLLTDGVFDDGGLECTMMNGYFVFDLLDIANYYGVDVTDICPQVQI